MRRENGREREREREEREKACMLSLLVERGKRSSVDLFYLDNGLDDLVMDSSSLQAIDAYFGYRRHVLKDY